MKYPAVLLLLTGFLLLASGCSGSPFTPAVGTAAVLVPSVHDEASFDIHLLLIPRRAEARREGMAVLYLPSESFSRLFTLPSPAGLTETHVLKRKMRELTGITPDTVYVTNPEQNQAAGELFSRLEGFDEAVEFSYGKESYGFWLALVRLAPRLSDERVLPLLEPLYDQEQISSSRFSRGLSRIAELESRVRQIPAVLDGSRRLPFEGRLLKEQVSQVINQLEGE